MRSMKRREEGKKSLKRKKLLIGLVCLLGLEGVNVCHITASQPVVNTKTAKTVCEREVTERGLSKEVSFERDALSEESFHAEACLDESVTEDSFDEETPFEETISDSFAEEGSNGNSIEDFFFEESLDGENPYGENLDGESPYGENLNGENLNGENPNGGSLYGENLNGENPDDENLNGESPDTENSGEESFAEEMPVEEIVFEEVSDENADDGICAEEFSSEEIPSEESAAEDDLSSSVSDSIAVESLFGSEPFVSPQDDMNSVSLPSSERGGNSWELSLYYTDSGNGGDTIFHGASEPIVWNAVQSQEKRKILLQVNYKNGQAETSYPAGSVEIYVPDLASHLDGTKSGSLASVSVAADPKGSGNLSHDWSYEKIRDQDGYYGYTFRNNYEIEGGSNFEGSIQIAWELVSDYGAKDVSFALSARLMEDIMTDPLPVEFHSNVKQYEMVKTPSALLSSDGLPVNSYYCVRFDFEAYADANMPGVRFLDPDSICFLDDFPSDCKVWDENLQLLTPVEGNTYRIPPIAQVYSQYYASQRLRGCCYVGYPKTTYQTLRVTNEVRLYGGFHELNACQGEAGTVGYIMSAECEFAAADFEFVYQGNLYGMSKKSIDAAINSALIRDSYEVCPFALGAVIRYDTGPLTVRIGDDITGILYSNGEFHLLENGEVWFTKLDMPRFKNANGQYFQNGKYTYSIYIRPEGSDTYELYQSYSDNSNKEILFPENIHVAAWYVEIENLQESLLIEGNTGNKMEGEERFVTYTCLSDPGVTDTGAFYNFGYLRVFRDGQDQIHAGYENYANHMSRQYISEYDLNTYGSYQYRVWASNQFHAEPNGVMVTKFIHPFTKDAANERFTTIVNLYFGYYRQRINSFNDTFYGYDLYDLLPLGMDVSSDGQTEMKMTSGDSFSYVRTAGGVRFPNRLTYYRYLFDHCTIEKTVNWRNTGRTMMHIRLDFRDDPLDITALRSIKQYISSSTWQEKEEGVFTIPVEVSYDSYLQYGSSYKNKAMICALDENWMQAAEGRKYLRSAYSKDDGSYDPDVVDVDGDGITEELFYVSSQTKKITETVSTHQDVAKYVQTDQNGFQTGLAEASPGSIYTYRLRVRVGSNRVTNLVIYDNLEEAYGESNHWQGEFAGVDTSYAAEKGYQVAVYYSPERNAGDLSADNSYLPYDDSVDPSLVKSLAFLYLDASGRPATLSPKEMTYVHVRMRAPEDPAAVCGLAYNGCRTQWNALDTFGAPVYEITGMSSNIVQVDIGSPAAESVKLVIRKQIDTDEIVWAEGIPIFTFCIQGSDTEGKQHELYRLLEFPREDYENHSLAEKSVSLDLPPGTYRIRELNSIRYRDPVPRDIINGSWEGNEAVFTLGKVGTDSFPAEGEAVFYNERATDRRMTDTCLVRNLISES